MPIIKAKKVWEIEGLTNKTFRSEVDAQQYLKSEDVIESLNNITEYEALTSEEIRDWLWDQRKLVLEYIELTQKMHDEIMASNQGD